VRGPCASTERASSVQCPTYSARELLAGESPDVVVLDVNLKGDMVYSLAEELLQYGVPMIFATGYDASILPPSLRGAPCLQKPIESHELVRAVKVHAARQ